MRGGKACGAAGGGAAGSRAAGRRRKGSSRGTGVVQGSDRSGAGMRKSGHRGFLRARSVPNHPLQQTGAALRPCAV